jgi:hypothetical protein
LALDRSLRTLELLLDKYRLDVDKAAESLARAVDGEQRARAALEAAQARVLEATNAVQTARAGHRTKQSTATTPDELQWARRFVERRADELAVARDGESSAAAAVVVARSSLDKAQIALGEARGRVEALTRRIAAIKKAAADRVEAVAEEEAADRWRRS